MLARRALREYRRTEESTRLDTFKSKRNRKRNRQIVLLNLCLQLGRKFLYIRDKELHVFDFFFIRGS